MLDKIQSITQKLPTVESISSPSGYGLMTEGSASFGMNMISLKP